MLELHVFTSPRLPLRPTGRLSMRDPGPRAVTDTATGGRREREPPLRSGRIRVTAPAAPRHGPPDSAARSTGTRSPRVLERPRRRALAPSLELPHRHQLQPPAPDPPELAGDVLPERVGGEAETGGGLLDAERDPGRRRDARGDSGGRRIREREAGAAHGPLYPLSMFSRMRRA